MATILVVDDREINRQFLRTLLGYKGHTVVEAIDGEDGLAKAIEHNPDLIITDILMPHVDGFEFLRNLRSHPEFVRTMVVVYTSTYLEQEARSLADRCGVFRVLLRPADPNEILEVVEESLKADGSTVHEVPDDSFVAEHKRLLTDKLAQKVAELEDQIAKRIQGEARLAAALSASGQRVLDMDVVTGETCLYGPVPGDLDSVELVGDFEKFLRAVHRDDIEYVRKSVLRAKKDHSDILVHYRLTADGLPERVIEARGRYTYNDNGEPIRLYGALLDVTEKVAAEKEQLLLAAVVEHSLDFIGSAAPDGSIMFVNEAGRRMVGMEGDDIVGTSMFRDIHPHHVAAIRDQALPILLATGEWRGEIQFVHRRTGESIPCECSCFAIKDSSGEVSQISIIARDIRARKETERQLNGRLAQLTALRRIDLAISGAVDLNLTLQIVMIEVAAIESVQSACVFIYDSELRYLEYAAGNGLVQNRQVQTLAEAAVSERRAVRDSYDGGATLEAMPLLAKGTVKGVLVVLQKVGGFAEQSAFQFLEAIASQLAIAIDNALLFEDLQRSRNDLAVAYDETLEGWSRALDLRDKETEGHSRRVTDLTMKIAREMRIPAESLQHIRRGALLHDIGKVGVPDAILLKQGPLDPEEQAIMRKHADYAMELLGPIAYLQPAIDIPYCHHERWDGTGYPRGLKGSQIPLSARIFAIADVWDALMSDRPYRKAWPREKVIEHIKNGSGTHFDPAVISAFMRVLSSG